MPDPNLPLLEEAAQKLIPFLDEIVFVGGVMLGLLITDQGAAPIRGTNDVDVIAAETVIPIFNPHRNRIPSLRPSLELGGFFAGKSWASSIS